MNIVRCGDCGGEMVPFENKRYNEQWAVKKTGIRCLQCNKLVEKIKDMDGVDYK